MRNSHFNMDFRCVITDANGKSVTTETVNMINKATMAGPEIVTQPESQIKELGEKASFTVEATGTGLTYQWQFKTKDATEWSNSSVASAKTATWTMNVGYANP